MADTLRCAVLGMAHDHLWGNLKELDALPDAELCAGADYNPVLRERFVERTGCDKVYAHYDELLDSEKPDAVLAFSATAEHAGIVEHYAWSKPICPSTTTASSSCATRRPSVAWK